MTSADRKLLRKIGAICRKDPAYRPDAYLFVLAGLHETLGRLPQPRHISGQELLEGLRLFGLDQFGPLATLVFEHWGVRSTEDFGRIVFTLVEHELLRKTDEDTLDDFRAGYDFSVAFNPQPLYKLAKEGTAGS